MLANRWWGKRPSGTNSCLHTLQGSVGPLGNGGCSGGMQDSHADGHSPPDPRVRSSSRRAASSCCRPRFCFSASCRWLGRTGESSPPAPAWSWCPLQRLPWAHLSACSWASCTCVSCSCKLCLARISASKANCSSSLAEASIFCSRLAFHWWSWWPEGTHIRCPLGLAASEGPSRQSTPLPMPPDQAHSPSSADDTVG